MRGLAARQKPHHDVPNSSTVRPPSASISKRDGSSDRAVRSNVLVPGVRRISQRWCVANACSPQGVLGLPSYPFLIVEHPIGSCKPLELKARAEVAYRQALPILLQA